MQLQSTTVALDPLVAAMPLAAKLRPATTVCAGLSYSRVSKSIQTTIPGQQERIERLARQYGVPIHKHLGDTKSGMRADREEYQILLAEAQTGHYSHVFLFKADRLARDSEELQRTIKMLWRLGMTVIDTSVGEITPQNLPVLAMLAEMEIRNLSERTIMGLEQRAAEGSKIGGRPLGYVLAEDEEGNVVPGRPVPDPALEPVLKDLFRRAAAGERLQDMCRWFQEQTSRTIDVATLRGILRNPYYMGLNVSFRQRNSILHGKHGRPHSEWKSRRHDHPIVDEATWTAVQVQLDQHANVGQHRAKTSPYALQGLIRCAACDRRIYGHNKPPKGRGYRCPLCRYERGVAKVEGAVRRCLERLPLDSRDAALVLLERISDQGAELRQGIEERQQSIAHLTRKRTRLYDRFDGGEIDHEQYAAQVAELDADRAELQRQELALKAQLAALPQMQSVVADVANARAEWLYWPNKIPAMDMAQQQKVYRECCKAIVVDARANTVRVEYTEHIALLMGEPCHTEAL
jgi:DNA invertase Pin-like site-specific DNA recombinase/DNA-directed RNA polymerase subunit RPC12/RpoP